ncbi:MAG: glutamate racemase [Tissierellia bacterium]|nr:glutamate racemase [Tissierellia bacterium]
MKKIGVYDSGMGGLSLLARLIRDMPSYDYIYYGDAANAPYGEKSREEIQSFARKAVKELITLGCESLVIACNTATSAAEDILREEFDLPIFGMEPAISRAMASRDKGTLLVLATSFTLNSPRFIKSAKNFENQRKIIPMPGPTLVRLVEDSIVEGEEIRQELEKMSQGIDLHTVDGIVLGCTHFLFLEKEIQRFFGPHVKIYDSHGDTLALIDNGLGRGQGGGSYRLISSAGKDREEKSQWMLENYLRELR